MRGNSEQASNGDFDELMVSSAIADDVAKEVASDTLTAPFLPHHPSGFTSPIRPTTAKSVSVTYLLMPRNRCLSPTCRSKKSVSVTLSIQEEN